MINYSSGATKGYGISFPPFIGNTIVPLPGHVLIPSWFVIPVSTSTNPNQSFSYLFVTFAETVIVSPGTIMALC